MPCWIVVAAVVAVVGALPFVETELVVVVVVIVVFFVVVAAVAVVVAGVLVQREC